MNAIVKRLGALVLFALCAQTAGAQAVYPNRPIKLIVPFPAGGGTDIVGRIISQKFAAELNQTIVIDNKSGAAGMIGAEIASKAAPDGYTLLLSTNSTHVLGPLLNPATPFSPTKDFSPISYAAQSPSMMIVPLTSPAKTVKEFIQLAQQQPGKLNFGCSIARRGHSCRLLGLLVCFYNWRVIQVAHNPSCFFDTHNRGSSSFASCEHTC